MPYRTYTDYNHMQCHFNKAGQQTLQFSNNVSGACFAGESSNEVFKNSIVEITNMASTLVQLSDYSLMNCKNLQKVEFNDCLTSIGKSTFDSCASLKEVILPSSLQDLGTNAFANCTALSSALWPMFEHDNENDFSFQLNHISQCAFYNDALLKHLCLPESITSMSNIDQCALSGTSLTSLGLPGIDSASIQQKIGQLGLKHDCKVYSSDGKRLSFIASTNTAVQDIAYSMYGPSMPIGRGGSLKMNTLYQLSEEAVLWCLDKSTRTEQSKKSKFPNENCPVVVFYIDTMTSNYSRKFASEVLLSNEFAEALKASTAFHCFMFVLNRYGKMQHASPDVMFLRNTLDAKGKHSLDFPSVNLYYDDNFSTFSCQDASWRDVISMLEQHANETGFNHFNYDQFTVKLEDPYIEEIPMGSDVAVAEFTPWWYKNGVVEQIQDW